MKMEMENEMHPLLVVAKSHALKYSRSFNAKQTFRHIRSL